VLQIRKPGKNEYGGQGLNGVLSVGGGREKLWQASGISALMVVKNCASKGSGSIVGNKKQSEDVGRYVLGERGLAWPIARFSKEDGGAITNFVEGLTSENKKAAERSGMPAHQTSLTFAMGEKPCANLQ